MANYHIDETTLLEYTTGALSEPFSVLAATHMALCSSCRTTSQVLEQTGGRLLETTDSRAVSARTRKQVFALLDAEDEAAPCATRPAAAYHDVVIPRPLRDYLDGRVDTLEFRKVSPGLAAIELLSDYPGHSTRLMRIGAGKSMPLHTHQGTEMTLVLDGGFSDAAGSYKRGDVAVADDTVEHQPVAHEGDDCICLAVTVAPVRLTGPVGRFLNPFVRF